MYKGVPPDPDAKRKRTHPDQVPATQLEEAEEPLGPELPETRQWLPETRAWWETWRRSPQAKLFLDTDWQSLLETAYLVELIWDPELGANTQLRAAAEVRLRVERWGATFADRLKLRMKSPRPASLPEGMAVVGSANGAVVRRIADYRDRLGA